MKNHKFNHPLLASVGRGQRKNNEKINAQRLHPSSCYHIQVLWQYQHGIVENVRTIKKKKMNKIIQIDIYNTDIMVHFGDYNDGEPFGVKEEITNGNND